MTRLVIVAVLLTATTAHADDGACKTARQTMKAQELTRASLLVDACHLEDEEAGAKLDLELTARFEELHYARVEIDTRPTGGLVIVDVVADLPFAAPRTVWLAPGIHDITAIVDGQPVARTTLNLKADTTAMATIDLPAAPAPGGEVQEVDFGEDGGPPELTTGGPEDEKFGSLLPERYLRGVHAEGEPEVAGPPRGELWIGAGITSSIFLGATVGIQGRYRLLGDQSQLGLAIDGQAAAGFDGGGVGVLGAAAFLTFSHEFRLRSVRIRETIGLGPGIRAGTQAATRTGPTIYSELHLSPRYSLVSRLERSWDARFWRRDPDQAFALMLGVRW